MTGVRLVESMLVEVELPVVEEAVHHRGRHVIEPEHVHPQPAAIEGAPGGVVLKGAQRRREKRGRAAVGAEAPLVETGEGVERGAALRLGGDLFEPHLELLAGGPQPPSHVGDGDDG